jgi:hypothetical protein
MSKNILLFLCLFPALARPQGPGAEAGAITKVVRVHNPAARNLAAVASGGSPVDVRADDQLKAIVLRGKPADVAALETTIRELDSNSEDRGSKNVELTVYLLSGSSSSVAESNPPTVAPVVKQLRAVFPYTNYQVLSTMLLRSGEGTRAETSGLLKGFGNTTTPSQYTVSYKAVRVSAGEAGPSIHLTDFHFVLHLAIEPPLLFAGIETDVDLRDGQKVVVGKSNIENVDSALFLVLAARLVE